MGIVGGTAEWLFIRGDVISVTVSAAKELAEKPASEISALTWLDISKALSYGWKPEISLKSGIKSTYSWALKNIF